MPSGVILMLRRLQIAVDDAAIVRRLERFRDLAPDRSDLGDRKRTSGQTFGQRRPSTSSSTSAATSPLSSTP